MTNEDASIAFAASTFAFVDIGNTSAKVATHVDSKLQVKAIDYHKEDWPHQVAHFPKSIHGKDIDRWVIASVNQAKLETLEHSIRLQQDKPVIQKVGYQDIPMETSVDHPQSLGIDRLLSGFMATKRFGAPLVVISFGTAVTIDWVDEQGVFAGGLILPGMQLQSDSLSVRTEALPEIQWEGDITVSLPGKNTQSAIRSGITLGLASAIDGLVGRYAEASRLPMDRIQTVITGGNAELITQHLQCKHHIATNLVCHALMELSAINT